MWFVDYDVKKYFVSQENFREMANFCTICKLQAIRAENHSAYIEKTFCCVNASGRQTETEVRQAGGAVW